MRNEIKWVFIFFCCTAAMAAQANGTPAVDSFFNGLKEVVDAGKVYVEDTDRFADKLTVYECADRYVKDLTFQAKTKEKIAEYYTCLKSASESEYSDKNAQFSGFESHRIDHEDDEEYSKRNYFIQFVTYKTILKLPHPMALLKKAAEDIGKFAFLNTVDGLTYKPRDRFVLTIKEIGLLILDSHKFGQQAFETKLKEKLAILAGLCAKNTVFQAEETVNAEKNEHIEAEYSAETLIELGQKIGGTLASAGGQHILPYQERVKLGIDTAQVQFPIYSEMLRKQAESKKDLTLAMSDLVKLGDEIVQCVESSTNPAQIQDDFDAKFYAIAAILFHLNKLQESKSTKSVKKAEFKEKNPLENAFKL